MPGPTAGFDDEVAATLRAQTRQIDRTQATDMMMVGQNQINAQDLFQHGEQGVIADLKPKLRATVLKQTATGHNMVLAQGAGTVAAMGAKNAQALIQGMMVNIMS